MKVNKIWLSSSNSYLEIRGKILCSKIKMILTTCACFRHFLISRSSLNTHVLLWWPRAHLFFRFFLCHCKLTEWWCLRHGFIVGRTNRGQGMTSLQCLLLGYFSIKKKNLPRISQYLQRIYVLHVSKRCWNVLIMDTSFHQAIGDPKMKHGLC